MLEIVIFPMALFIGGFIAGYWLCSHIHKVAANAASVVNRATTIASGDVAKLNTAVSNLGYAAAKLVQSVSKPDTKAG